MVKILTEEETLDAATKGVSLSRFGDGELRVAAGGNCYGHREQYPKAISELRSILRNGTQGLMVCLPRYGWGPKRVNWDRYNVPRYVSMFGKQVFGSAFITRPDSAPQIDTPVYWEKVEGLWSGKDVTLVAGSGKSLVPSMLGEANKIRFIEVPEAEAYAHIDAIEEGIGTPSHPVLLCCGVTATILAWRLARKGVHALDLGHIGMFMRHRGAYRFTGNDLVSDAYRRQLTGLHKDRKWGISGRKQSGEVKAYADKLGVTSILDYGCGQGTLRKALQLEAPGLNVAEYDPAIHGKDALPKPAPLVVCTDVLEHVEPDKIAAVLEHLRTLTGEGAYFAIATRPANAKLPDGRNAHLTVQTSDWWVKAVEAAGFTVARAEVKEAHEVRLWLLRAK